MLSHPTFQPCLLLQEWDLRAVPFGLIDVLVTVAPPPGSLFHEDDTSGFADQFHVAFQQQNRTLTAQLERVGVALIDLSIQDW